MDVWTKIITVICRGDRSEFQSLEKKFADSTLLKIVKGIQKALQVK